MIRPLDLPLVVTAERGKLARLEEWPEEGMGGDAASSLMYGSGEGRLPLVRVRLTAVLSPKSGKGKDAAVSSPA